MILKPLMSANPFQKFDVRRAYQSGDWDLDRIRYRNVQWAVTDYGIENVRGPYHYHIPKTDLKISMGSPDRTWVDHMASKNWVDIEAFDDAYKRALKIFGSDH